MHRSRHQSAVRAISRRQLIRGLLATGALSLSSKAWVGCTPTSTLSTNTRSGTTGEPLTLGFIYVGSKDDYGWNQAHFEGKKGLDTLADIKTIDQDRVPETTAVQEAMLSMINQDGAAAIFPTSFGYFEPHILKIAAENPQVQFFHAGGLYREGQHPKNVGSYFAYIDEALYVAGIVAGHMAKTGKLGFIAAKPIPLALRNINSYTLGAQSVNPQVTTQLIFTGNWSLPVKEAEAANSMADQGIEVITCHVDSPKVVIETAERRGVYCVGYQTNQAKLAPKWYLTGAEWDWSTMYANYAEMLRSGKTLMDGTIPHLIRGGYQDGYVKISDYGAVVTDAAKQDAEAAKQRLKQGTLIIYKGELKDNTGRVVIPAGKVYDSMASELETMDWLVAGVMGSTRS